MKKIIAGLFLTGTFVLASAQTVSFDKTTLDYGTVKLGTDGHRSFTVKNIGDKPLIISKVQAQCGCTTPEIPTDPIMPGKTAQLKVGYDTNIAGPFVKIIEVYSNDPENGRSVINIKGNVDANATIAPAAVAATVIEKTATKAKTTKKKVARK